MRDLKLANRLSRLERARVTRPDNGARDRLGAKLSQMEAVVVASGDASDRPGASPIERMVRRYLRREADMSEALRDTVARRWP
ncbi:hypothetical protein SAMN04488238_1036 [Roseicitreum antarcticum]|uniref:Uncharacterized protein n=2 Tax=Roseicitreum antarcticum TaxID=564137 RepID=A0A1H2VBS9_9RHOB|nr:hypothetical protein SAMN04488238_1036 [Roseicitreum antarcticum]